jgi:hypothetical protein
MTRIMDLYDRLSAAMDWRHQDDEAMLVLDEFARERRRHASLVEDARMVLECWDQRGGPHGGDRLRAAMDLLRVAVSREPR